MLDLEYRKDPDLDFLEFVPGYELADLVKILTTNGANDKYSFQELDDDLRFKSSKDPHSCWNLIAAELQTFGGDTRANFLRRMFKDGSGITYAELLDDALDVIGFKSDAKNLKKKEEDFFKGCYTRMNNTPPVDFSGKAIKTLANEVWKNWKQFWKKCPVSIKNKIPLIGDNIISGPKYQITIPSILYVVGLRKEKNELADKYNILSNVSLGIIGMQQSGKSTYLELLRNGEVEEQLKRTFGEVPYEAFQAKVLGINVEGGVDIAGGDANVTHYSEYVMNKERILFFFNAKSYLMPDESNLDYAEKCQGRFHYVYEKIYKDGIAQKSIKFIGTHIDEMDESDRICAKDKIYDSLVSTNAEFAKMFSENPDALFVTDLKHAQWSDNFEGYINLMKFTLGV